MLRYRTRRIPLTRRLLFALAVSTGAWLGLEGIVTVLYAAELSAWESPPPSPRKGVSVMQGHPYLIYEYVPGRHPDGGVTLTINSLGLRGPEIAIPKPDGIRRLITTGDSSVFGFGVQDNEVFSSVAGDLLGDSVEPVIGATPGYSTYQSLNLLRLRGLSTEPDLFVIGNLWSDNNFDAFVDKETIATLTGFEESSIGRVKRALTTSAVFRVADWKLRVRPQIEKVRVVDWQQSSEDRGQIGRRRVEINDYADNLDYLVEIARTRDADVVFLLLSNNEDIGPEGDARAMKAWNPYREVMRETAKRHGAPLLDVPALFKESGLSRDDLFLDKMHPTARGHAIIGTALADLLKERGWMEGKHLWTEGTGEDRPEYEDPFLKSQDEGSSVSIPSTVPPTEFRIEGEVTIDDFPSGGLIHMDLVPPGRNQSEVLASIQLQGPGKFVLPVGTPRQVVIRAYVDPKGDGPDADDARFAFEDNVVDVSDGPAMGIRLDLTEGTFSGN
ncbi:MAG: hypothetical protein CL927_15005 [Deltaproteobacteria bacterium]|nr:hypothetical protein [Deltaproteobacteria bacterium]HCH64896.1 hypothetical protein [Deltaproteobacteria bacterium]